jgi:hypothetical protein
VQPPEPVTHKYTGESQHVASVSWYQNILPVDALAGGFAEYEPKQPLLLHVFTVAPDSAPHCVSCAAAWIENNPEHNIAINGRYLRFMMNYP